jgi:hypothetical protein
MKTVLVCALAVVVHFALVSAAYCQEDGREKERGNEPSAQKLPPEPAGAPKTVSDQEEKEALNSLEGLIRSADPIPKGTTFDIGKLGKEFATITEYAATELVAYCYVGELRLDVSATSGRKFSFRVRAEPGRWLKVRRLPAGQIDPPPNFYWPRQNLRVFGSNGNLLRTTSLSPENAK